MYKRIQTWFLPLSFTSSKPVVASSVRDLALPSKVSEMDFQSKINTKSIWVIWGCDKRILFEGWRRWSFRMGQETVGRKLKNCNLAYKFDLSWISFTEKSGVLVNYVHVKLYGLVGFILLAWLRYFYWPCDLQKAFM